MRNCKKCGEEFKPKKSNQKFCSHKCSVRYNRAIYDFGDISWLGKKKLKTSKELEQ